ncbi:molybdopterin-binding protein [Malaciobacter molluscorum]|uniref:competence/damage-inducible protein A n=1 Tax=Malaciobacter molluscorum TaxID=1032072 RepID=UPI00100BA8D9|nr:molybdopterin-binding protein [Malaciobacter molluscorum]RXJ94152.1 molybdopterin-binding protein [Malaciobacter molluscorum]
MNQPNFYSVIIGTELLNGRRKDAHFSFLNHELLLRGWTHKASFVIEDDPFLMENTFKLIKSDENSVMFCFGGIGSTPDDLTRQIAAKVFRDNKMSFHPDAKQLVENEFKQKAYPHRINMAYLPINSKLLDNVVNNVPGFYLDDRFFFTPGFPSMSQSMVLQALNTLYPKNCINKYRLSLTANCGESDLIDIMNQMPKEIELSSLPKFVENGRQTVISLSSTNEKILNESFQKFIEHLQKLNFSYVLRDINF